MPNKLHWNRFGKNITKAFKAQMINIYNTAYI